MGVTPKTRLRNNAELTGGRGGVFCLLSERLRQGKESTGFFILPITDASMESSTLGRLAGPSSPAYYIKSLTPLTLFIVCIIQGEAQSYKIATLWRKSVD